MKKLIALFILFAVTACDDRTASQIAEDVAKERIDIIQSAAEVVKNEGEGTAGTVAEGVGNIINGFTSGFDESLIKTEVRTSADINPDTLAVTRSQRMDSTGSEGLSLYLSSVNGFSGKLRLRAISNDGEVGRSSVDVNIAKDGAEYVNFEFDKRTPFNVVGYYSLTQIAN